MNEVKRIVKEIMSAIFITVVVVGLFCKLWKIMFEEYLIWKEGE